MQASSINWLLGVDTGGTFTDFVAFNGRHLKVHKVLSTPKAPEQAILQGVAELELDLRHLTVVHGSTVATNAALEGKGVRTVFITNRGLRDILTIGRQARRELYNLNPVQPVAPVAEELCLETGGRLNADGEFLEPLTDEDLRLLQEQVRELAPQSVAINLLFSFLNDEAERAIEAAMPDGLFVCRSSEVLPEYREYERGIATWLNAWVGPLVEGYLARLSDGLAPAPVAVMQSSGRTVEASQAGRLAVHMLLSGPAGGLQGALAVGRAAGREKLLTFDMGGTSTDVALLDGEVSLTGEGHIGPWPVGVPMVDMHTIGAGGGSIAWVDDGGLLQVGPQSAGADPGPVCYGRGGKQATVTDANLVLGRLRADAFLGGGMSLDVDAARQALALLGESLDLGLMETAEGIIRLANEHMAAALRVISVQRGIDPHGFSLTSFGGAGGLHVCALAEALEMRQALVPIHAGVLSALGMLAAPRGRELSRTLNVCLAELDEAVLQSTAAELREQGIQALLAEGLDERDLHISLSADLRYRGQSYTLTVPWQDRETSQTDFHQRHQQRYGHAMELPVELVNLRLSLEGPRPQLSLHSMSGECAATPQEASVYGIDEKVPVRWRDSIQQEEVLSGPLLITETVATTWLAPGWQAVCDASGNLLLER